MKNYKLKQETDLEDRDGHVIIIQKKKVLQLGSCKSQGKPNKQDINS